MALDENLVEAHDGLAGALHALGLREEAIATYRRAIESNPGYAAAYYNLAIVLKEAGHRRRGTG